MCSTDPGLAANAVMSEGGAVDPDAQQRMLAPRYIA